MRRLWIRAAIALSAVCCLCASAQAQPQPQPPKCSKCVVKTGPYATYHADPTVCPGKDQVVCDTQYDKDYDADCVSGETEEFRLLDCKKVTNAKIYPTKKYPANTCGALVKDNQGKVISVTCGLPPAGAPAGPNYNSTAASCTGDNWDVTGAVLLPPERRFVLSFVTPFGLTMLPEQSTTALAETQVEIPAALLRLPSDNLRAEGDYIKLGLLVKPIDNSMFSIPDQTFKPTPANDALQVNAARVENGGLALELAVRRGDLWAYRSYVLDLKGLQVHADAASALRGSLSTEGVVVPSDSPDLLQLTAVLTGNGQPLVTGGGVVARLATNPALSPQEPAREKISAALIAAVALAALLIISWLFFLTRRRRGKSA